MNKILTKTVLMVVMTMMMTPVAMATGGNGAVHIVYNYTNKNDYLCNASPDGQKPHDTSEYKMLFSSKDNCTEEKDSQNNVCRNGDITTSSGSAGAFVWKTKTDDAKLKAVRNNDAKTVVELNGKYFIDQPTLAIDTMDKKQTIWSYYFDSKICGRIFYHYTEKQDEPSDVSTPSPYSPKKSWWKFWANW